MATDSITTKVIYDWQDVLLVYRDHMSAAWADLTGLGNLGATYGDATAEFHRRIKDSLDQIDRLIHSYIMMSNALSDIRPDTT